MQLPDGLYDLVLSRALAKILEEANSPFSYTVDLLGEVDSPERLAEAFTRQLTSALDEVEGDPRERTRQQLQLVNDILVHLRKRSQATDEIIEALDDPPRILRSIHRRSPPNISPETGLMSPWLFTAGKGSPSLLLELRRELAACDQADVLMSFVTVSGVRKLADVLTTLTAIGADGQPKAKLRLLTTTYTGATEIQALDTLSRLPGCEIKVSLDGRRTRLHAKAWIFHRATGFGSAYVGSANLSGAALAGGLEWTVKFTERR